jgi:PIN domain nuclease of toxin-antitoxin system
MEDYEKMILLDTHALIWLASEPAKLSTTASDAIRTANQRGGLAISAITLWELSWLATHGRIDFTGTVNAFVGQISARTSIRPITVEIAVLASQLPSDYPNDPGDRLIGATAMVEGMALITKDRIIRQCKQINTIW